MAVPADRGIPLSTLCPKYLQSNATSHTLPFSAIAELIDNAYDPDVNAKQLWIDKTVVKGQECLTFMDNGNGLTFESMQKMLSFGYSDKTALNGKNPIGIYGNGFKSGSMRLGSDAMVFSKSKATYCVGMLSQTYLKMINAQQIIIPIVRFEGQRHRLHARGEDMRSLQDILQYSPFKTESDLLLEMDAITSPLFGETGTRIIIWNLSRTSPDKLELDFETDRYDIRIPLEVSDTFKDEAASYRPETSFKLRAYCSILYLKPKMQIILRGQKVQTQLVAKSLALIRKDHYKPTFLRTRIPITFGYNPRSKDHYGVMMYHKNRLIKAYKRIGCQLKANEKGVGVIAVIECNFLDPTHNKQSFNETDKYSKTMASLGSKLEEYWNEIRHKRKQEDPNCKPVEDAVKQPDQNWAQCDACLKWRRIPDGIECKDLPDKWFCFMNPDPQFRSCTVEEEPEDTDEEEPYRKTYKQHERENKKKKEMERLKEEEKQKAEQARKHQELSNLLRAPTSRFATAKPVQMTAQSPKVLSPDFDNTFPLSSEVLSLKRPQPTIPQQTAKRQKLTAYVVSMLDPITSVKGSPSRSHLENSTSSDTLANFVNSTTQTNVLKVKKDKPQSQNKWQRSPKKVDVLASRLRAKQQPTEENMHDSDHGDHSEMHRVQKEVTCPSVAVNNVNDSTRRSRPQDYLNMTNSLEKQDQLQATVQTTARERDALKEQVERLSTQLQEAQVKLKEQTDYQDLFRKVKQKVDELIKNSTVSLPDIKTEPSAVQGEWKDACDVVQPVEFLIQELEQRNKERDELSSQLEAFENEMTKLGQQCEEQNLALQQRESSSGESLHERTTVPLKHNDSWNAPEMQCKSTLVSLRRNIGRLLVNFIPDLDLNQVNYECEVIDEILQQFIMSPESGGTTGLRLKGIF